MTTINKGLLERLRKLDGKHGDSRYYPEQELRLYVWFHEHLCSELGQIGGEETGYVFRQRGSMVLLVYKARIEGIPQVVFITARTPVDCMKVFCRQFYGDTLKWVADQYA